MSSSDALWRCGQVVSASWAEYLASYPWPNQLISLACRQACQLIVLTMLGAAAGGRPGAGYAFVGGTAFMVLLPVVGELPAVLVVDRDSNTVRHLQTAALPVLLIVALRSLPYLSKAAANLAECLLIAPLLGLGGLAWRLVPLVPVYLLIAVTGACLGASVAAASMVLRFDAIVANVLGYLTLVSSGAVIPVEHIWLARQVGARLPLTHGVLAIRAALVGNEDFVGELAREACTGAAWAVVACAIFGVYHRLSRRTGWEP